MSQGVIQSLLPAIDSILGVRDHIGAVIQPVYIVTRTWYTDDTLSVPADGIGGSAVDEEVQMLPSPELKNFAQDIRLREGGAVKNSDIILHNVSKNKYAESDLDGTSPAPNVEKLFRVGDKMYSVITVTEKYVTWDVQLRELSNQTRYV